MERDPTRLRRALLCAALLCVPALATLPSAAAHAQSARPTTPPRTPSAAEVERARVLFTEGSQHYQAGRLEPALEAFLGAWRLVGSPALAYNVARTYERRGEASRAIQFYRHYLSRADADAAERAEVEGRIREIEAVERRQRDQIMTAPPSDDELTQEARTFFTRGVAMFRRRQYEAAMAAFTAAYNFARLPEVVYNIAITAERLERTQDAIDYFREYARTLPRESSERALIDHRVRELRAR